MISIVSGFLRTQAQIVRCVKGSTTIRAEGSEVTLTTPSAIHAFVLGNILTNHSRFQHIIPSNECIVGPACQYSIFPFINSPGIPQRERFTLKIPHIAKNVEKVKNYFRVRHGNIHGPVPNLKLITPLNSSHHENETYFEVDDKYCTIITRDFCHFIPTIEEINCCSGSANVLLYGSLINEPNQKPLASLKVYMASLHFQISDYQTVSYLFYILF